MRPASRSIWFVALTAIAAGALAVRPQPAAAAPPPVANSATTVSELIVTATKTVSELTVTPKIKCLKPDAGSGRMNRPRIVSSYPAKGDVVRPGLLVVRVTFDQPMACDGLFTAAPPLEDPCPQTSQDLLLSLDRKTVRTVCLVAADTQYGLWVTQDPTAHSFIGLGGLPSESYRLNFATSSGSAVASICDAMLEDAETARQLRERGSSACPGEAPAP
jgi:hypothetical protein